MELITIIVIATTIIAGFFLFVLSLCNPFGDEDLSILLGWIATLIITSAGIIFLIVRFVKYVWELY